MNLQIYLEKLYESKSFGQFIKQYKDAYLCGGFFIIDLIGDDNQQHFDFFVPSIKKMFSFEIEHGVQMVPLEIIDKRVPEKVGDDYDVDFEDIKNMIYGEMNEQKIKNKIQKIILSMQHFEDKDWFIGTIFISGMGMIKIQIDIFNMKIVEFEKKSFFDFLKKI